MFSFFKHYKVESIDKEWIWIDSIKEEKSKAFEKKIAIEKKNELKKIPSRKVDIEYKIKEIGQEKLDILEKIHLEADVNYKIVVNIINSQSKTIYYVFNTIFYKRFLFTKEIKLFDTFKETKYEKNTLGKTISFISNILYAAKDIGYTFKILVDLFWGYYYCLNAILFDELKMLLHFTEKEKILEIIYETIPLFVSEWIQVDKNMGNISQRMGKLIFPIKINKSIDARYNDKFLPINKEINKIIIDPDFIKKFKPKLYIPRIVGRLEINSDMMQFLTNHFLNFINNKSNLIISNNIKIEENIVNNNIKIEENIKNKDEIKKLLIKHFEKRIN